jgi:hypothetical protein
MSEHLGAWFRAHPITQLVVSLTIVAAVLAVLAYVRARRDDLQR